MGSRSALAGLLAGVTVLGAATSCAAAETTTWASSYWHDFLDYWGSFFRRQDGVVMTVLVAGAVALFIITRVKGNKG